MSLDNLQLEQGGKGEEVRENVLSETSAELQDLSKQVQDVAADKGQKFAESIQITPQLEADVGEFIRAAVNNELKEYTGEFNAKNFDIDGEEGLDQFEFERFAQSLDSAIDQIILLDGFDAFSDVHADSASTSWYEVDKHTAKALNKLTDGVLDSMIGDDKDGSLAEKLLNGLDISDSEIHQMREKDFSIKSRESWKELGILLALEMGEGVEDMIRFLINIPSAVVLIPRYLNLRVQLNSNNPKEAAEAEIMLDELVEQNLALGLLNLLGEDGIQAIKSIATMMTSGKQGDIALSLVSIAGLVAGGAGALRMTAKMSKMSKLENAATRVQRGAERVDDVVGQAGIGHLTGGFNPAETPPSLANSDPLAAEPRFDQATLQKNANLSPADRQAEASRILGRPLTPEQKRAILEAHEIGSSEVGKYSGKELVVKRRILTIAGFTKSEANQLMDKGITGEFERMRNPKVEHHKSLRNIDATELLIGDVIAVKTKNGSEYNFTVTGKIGGRIFVQWEDTFGSDGKPVKGVIGGDSGNNQIKLGEPLFIGSGHTSRLTEIQVQPGGKRANAPEKTLPSSPRRSPEAILSLNVSNFNIGQNVIIPRSNGSQSVAQVAEFMPDGSVKVIWTQGNERFQKIIDTNKLKAVPAKIEDVDSFESLEFYLQSLPEGGIKGYDAEELINLVRQVRKGELTSDHITRTGGLRGKVNELLSAKNPPRSINESRKLEYHKPFESVDAREVLVDDVISVKTRSGSEYNFTVIGRVGDEIYVRWEGQFGKDGKPVEGVVGGLSGNNQIKLGKPLFIGSGNTSELTEIQIKPRERVANALVNKPLEISREPSNSKYLALNDFLKSGVKLSEDTRFALEFPELNPVKEVQVDGRKFYLSQRMGGGPREVVVAYTEVDGVLKTRFFYKSHSDGGWRLNSPSSHQIFSKGRLTQKADGQYNYRHYTRETKPHEALSNAFDELPLSNDRSLYSTQETVLQEYYKGRTNVPDYKDETQDGLIFKPFVDIGRNGERVDGGAVYGNITIDAINRLRYPEGFIPDFSRLPIRSYNMTHTLLSQRNAKGKVIPDIKVEVFESRLPSGERLEWHFASDPQGRVWIEKINTPDTSKMNSFGIQSKVNDFGILDLKPLDYTHQVEGIPDSHKREVKDSNDYRDITPFIAELGPVKMYREYLNGEYLK